MKTVDYLAKLAEGFGNAPLALDAAFTPITSKELERFDWTDQDCKTARLTVTAGHVTTPITLIVSLGDLPFVQIVTPIGTLYSSDNTGSAVTKLANATIARLRDQVFPSIEHFDVACSKLGFYHGD